MSLSLLRADCTNAHFSALEAEWTHQSREEYTDLESLQSPNFIHAKTIAQESPSDHRYGIYLLFDDDEASVNKYKGIVHINHAWPGTSGATLRMLWVILAPYYDYVEIDPLELGELVAGFLYGGIQLCQNQLRANTLKLYLTGLTDRQFAFGLVSAMHREMPGVSISVKGNWVHLENL